MKCEREIALLLLRCCGMKDVLVFQNKSTVSDRGNWQESKTSIQLSEVEPFCRRSV